MTDAEDLWLNRRDLATWLRGHRLAQTVGHACDTCGCPLAMYLREIGYCRARVVTGGIGWIDDHGDPRIVPFTELSSWVASFVEYVDLIHPKGGAVSAREARVNLIEAAREVPPRLRARGRTEHWP